jgi:Bacteriophage Sf6, terminase small subunit-like
VDKEMKKPKKIGAPTLYTEELAARICERLASGESLSQICRDPAMPCIATIFVWFSKHPSFVENYTRARTLQAEVYFDQMVAIADTPEKAVKRVTRPGPKGGDQVETTETDATEHRRLRIETRKWVLGRMLPQKYGDKTQVEMSGRVDGTISIIASEVDKKL